MKQRFYFVALLALFAFSETKAQRPSKPDAAHILLKLKKLNFLGTALYVAAHPDDENTRLIAYLANGRLARTAYLSLTRGDGGQNLVGPEIREGLGVIRTQELLAARRMDGGQQFFSRANDFGYSKSTEETQKIWNREEVLSDVVWVFRKFKPDVIITRFPPDSRAGHGHHTTSAIFAEEAFKLAGDPDKYPDQLKHVDTWKPKRLYTNTGRWWNPDMTGDEPGVLTVDVGQYNALLGESYTEIAARSRSQHKSQGFGSTGSRGESKEFLEFRVGNQAKKDLFEGIDTSWKKVKGGGDIEKAVLSAIDQYDPSNPAAIVPLLLTIKEKITTLQDGHWKAIKLQEVDVLLKDVMGLYLEVTANDHTAAPGEKIVLNVEAINRSSNGIKLKSIHFADLADSTVNTLLANNVRMQFKKEVIIPESFTDSQPYWLKEKGSLGMYRVEELALRGTPENTPALMTTFEMDIYGNAITFQVPVVYKWNDPVDGELYRPFNITPPVFVNIDDLVYIFPSEEAKEVVLKVKSGKEKLAGELYLQLPSGWKCTPARHEVQLERKGEEKKYSFSVFPPSQQSTGDLKAVVSLEGQTYDNSLQVVEYDHIPTQMLLPKATTRLVKIDIERKGDLVGYIQGAGDAVPAALREIGYEVWEMSEEDITPENLEKLDAVILGIRALNTNDRISFYMDDLLAYVKKGGTMITQYNTSRRLKTDNFAPYPLKLSRARVAEEDATIRILNPEHPVMNEPNKITQKDFDGWVQERGLYFPGEWDERYEAILSSNDTGEDARDGGLLVTKYGEGYYIYSGYSWFRELPAGVPGAFRLFVNMVSLGNEKPEQIKYGHNQN
ncbi:PIG-L family deacetylase [Fulvivirga sp. M361]|uniref:PIG-L family deacetylase n=1 Tax=Fulvivirga sp. M361 TaxID=2594266 RepID=UPI00117B50F3|nr:PIG-L family deacetylase [Fulvivirga sp. M361]TRX51293.1 PIG-L family deacetylase [Fulvivirga sp. M361]